MATEPSGAPVPSPCRRTLVIGGHGVIGHFVARRLVARGERPVLLSRSADPTLVADIVGACDHLRGDMTDAAGLDAVMREHRITQVVHLGAALPALTERDPVAAVRLNTEGTAAVLDAACRHGVQRVVLASSKAVYGPMKGEHGAPTLRPASETLTPVPNTVYGITKLAAEQLGAWYRRRHGLEVVSLRFAATIGPGKIARHGGSYSRYSVLLEHGMSGAAVTIDSAADSVCDGLYNDEAARGILCALDARAPSHDVYNIATGTGFTLRQFAAAVQRLFPAARFDIAPVQGDGGAMNFVLDPSRARDDLGFVADADLDRIVAAYVQTMRQLGLAPDAPQR